MAVEERDGDDTLRVPIEDVLDDELRSLRTILEALPDSPRNRELRARLSTFQRALERCRGLETNHSQRTALCELVGELRADAEALSDVASKVLAQMRPDKRMKEGI